MKSIYNTHCDIKKHVHILYLLAIITMGTTGIVLNITGTKAGLGTFAFYTTQSNLLCILAAAFYILQILSKQKISQERANTIHGAVVICIMLTFLVFHFLLRRIDSISTYLGPGNIFVHYVVPLMIAGEYLLFQAKGTFRIRMVWGWTLIPLAYTFFTYTYSAFGGRFGYDKSLVPYFFMDYTVYGIGGTILWLLAIATGYIGLSLLLVGLDSLLAKWKGMCKKHDI